MSWTTNKKRYRNTKLDKKDEFPFLISSNKYEFNSFSQNLTIHEKAKIGYDKLNSFPFFEESVNTPFQ